MSTCDVQVYRLWPNGRWDTTTVEVEDQPWNAEIVEARACTRAWLDLANHKTKPVRIGLYTVMDDQDARSKPTKPSSVYLGELPSGQGPDLN